MRDSELIETVRQCSQRWLGGARGRYGRLSTHRFHLIEAGRYTGALSPDSTMKPDWTLINYLYRAGREETEKWLGRHRTAVGRRSSVDLKARFLTRKDGSEAPEASSEAAAVASKRRLADAAGT
jgi:NTE family protein